jgi:hypothetical protein
MSDGITITIEKTITIERIKDLLCAAFEGGISYWAIVTDGVNQADKDKVGAEHYHEIPALGGEFPIYDNEDYDGQSPISESKLGVINLERIKIAFDLMAKGKNEDGSDAEYLKEHLNDFLNENEDANTGDVFVQMAVMGKVEFG